MVKHPVTGRAAMSAYQTLILRIHAVRAAPDSSDISDDEFGFAFHSLCVGLANSELARLPPPRGAGFWHPVRDVDGERLWRTTLSALIQGLGRPG